MSQLPSSPAVPSFEPVPAASAAGRVFDERYGVGAFDTLTRLFAQPCLTYVRIAAWFGVTRERVRQWHRTFAPDSPSGHARRRLCQELQQRRRLASEPAVLAFMRTARLHAPHETLRPVRTRKGYRKHQVRMGRWTVVVRRARLLGARTSAARPAYALTGSRMRADFFYYQLPEGGFLFVPAGQVGTRGTTFLDTPTSKFGVYKNVLRLHDGRPADGPRKERHDAAR